RLLGGRLTAAAPWACPVDPAGLAGSGTRSTGVPAPLPAADGWLLGGRLTAAAPWACPVDPAGLAGSGTRSTGVRPGRYPQPRRRRPPAPP
ncbi:hypothetical protein ACWCP0_24310, partial [Streptomyces sp. NPDC001970]